MAVVARREEAGHWRHCRGVLLLSGIARFLVEFLRRNPRFFGAYRMRNWQCGIGAGGDCADLVGGDAAVTEPVKAQVERTA